MTQSTPGSPRSWKEALIVDRWRLAGIMLLIGGAIILFEYEIVIPRWAKLFTVVTIVASILGYAPAARIVAWLYRPDYTYLVELDATGSDLAVWALPPDTWRDIEITEGELFNLQAAVPAWECQEYNPYQNAAVGTWRGSASDLELIRERGRIAEIRGTLEDLAKEGLGYRVMQSGIVRAAVRSVVLSFIEAFENDAVYDGREIHRAVERTLNDWEYDDDGTPPNDLVGDDGTLAEANQVREDSERAVDSREVDE